MAKGGMPLFARHLYQKMATWIYGNIPICIICIPFVILTLFIIFIMHGIPVSAKRGIPIYPCLISSTCIIRIFFITFILCIIRVIHGVPVVAKRGIPIYTSFKSIKCIMCNSFITFILFIKISMNGVPVVAKRDS